MRCEYDRAEPCLRTPLERREIATECIESICIYNYWGHDPFNECPHYPRNPML